MGKCRVLGRDWGRLLDMPETSRVLGRLTVVGLMPREACAKRTGGAPCVWKTSWLDGRWLADPKVGARGRWTATERFRETAGREMPGKLTVGFGRLRMRNNN